MLRRPNARLSFPAILITKPRIWLPMRLSRNEIRARAAKLSAERADATYEKGEVQGFCDAFFVVFGIQRRMFASVLPAPGRRKNPA